MAASFGKRLRPRQDISYELQAAKRQRTKSKLELLQDQVKAESELLDSYLTKTLEYLPTDGSALDAKEFIEDAKYFFDMANHGQALRQMATFLETDLDAVFSGVAPQVKPSE
jgi:hypothetical protein